MSGSIDPTTWYQPTQRPPNPARIGAFFDQPTQRAANVPRSEVVRVRRWIRRYRAEAAQTRGLITALRRLFASDERRERRRVRVQVIYRPVETA